MIAGRAGPDPEEAALRDICRIASRKRRNQLLAMPLEKRRRVLQRNGILRPARALRLYETADYSAVLASIHQKPQRVSTVGIVRGIAVWIKTLTATARLVVPLFSPRALIPVAGAGLLAWLSSQPNPVGAVRAFRASEWDYKFQDATVVLRGTAKNIKAKPIALFVPVAASKAAAREGRYQVSRLTPGGEYKIVEDLGDVLQIESSGGTGWVMGRYVDRR